MEIITPKPLSDDDTTEGTAVCYQTAAQDLESGQQDSVGTLGTPEEHMQYPPLIDWISHATHGITNWILSYLQIQFHL